jgi:pimeloyl-ACP methyl ester carboxylesterase
MKKLILLSLCFSLSAFAQLKENALFKKQGKKVVTTFVATNYVAKRDLMYYIPDSVDLTRPTTVVVYLHGGNSNMEQSRSTDTAETLFWGTADGPFAKKHGIRPMADEQQFIVVMPTTTTGWNDFTPHYMKDLLKVIRKELNPDPNKIFLMGHSMGAMGICRAVSRLADEFAMFMPMSGGFQPHLKNLNDAGPMFNTQVWATVGARYDFNDFRLWNEDFSEFIHSSYIRDYFKPSRPLEFEYELHPLDHNPNVEVMNDRLKKFLPGVSRNMYQPELFGYVYKNKSSDTYIRKDEITRYFWFEALEFRPLEGTETGISMTFRIYSKNNEINVTLDRPGTFLYDTRPHLKKIRLHLSEKQFNLNEPVTINLITKRGAVDEKTVLHSGLIPRNDSASAGVIKETGDKGFNYEAFIDLGLPRN